MNSDVLICNMALSRLGASRISSLEVGTDNNNNAATCSVFYAHTVKEVLAVHDWSFATKRCKLAQLADDNYTPFTYKYQMSSDIISVSVLTDDDGNDLKEEDFSIEGDSLYCNLSPCWIKYITSNTPEKIFSPMFTELLILRLAYKIAFSITNEEKYEIKFAQLYEGYLRKVKGKDTGSKKKRPRGKFSWSEGS